MNIKGLIAVPSKSWLERKKDEIKKVLDVEKQ